MRLKAPAIATLLALGSTLVGSSLSAQLTGNPKLIISETDVIPNLGQIQNISRIAVSDQGIVFTQVTITSDALRYMMRDNFPTFVNNLLLPEPGPPGVYTMRTTGLFSSFELDDKTNVAWRLQSTNSGGGTGLSGNHTGIYYNLKLIHNDLDNSHNLGGAINLHFPNLTNLSNWTYRGFNGVDSSNDGSLILNCTLDSNGTASGGSSATALILVKIDDQGGIESEEVLVLSSSNAASTEFRSNAISNRQNTYEVANNGNWIAVVRFDMLHGLPTTNSNDWAVITNNQAASISNTIIAREDSTVVGVGKVATNGVAGSRASINSFGETAFMARINGNQDHLVVKGQLLAAEGGSALNLPSLAPNSVRDFELNGGPPLKITDSGDVYWYARLTGLSTTNRAFMRNDKVVVRKGFDMLNGVLIRDLIATDRGFTVSNSGRFWAGIIKLAGGGNNAVILIDWGLVVRILGTDTNPSSVGKLSGDSRLGELLVLGMDNSQGPGSVPIMYFSLQAAIPGSPTGIMTKFGEILIDLNPGLRLAKIVGAPVTSGPSNISIAIPPDPALVGLNIYGQGLFLDAGSSNGGPVLSLTNGLHLVIGSS